MTNPNAEAEQLFRLADEARDRGDWLLADMYNELAALVRTSGPHLVADAVLRALRYMKARA